MSDRKKSWLSSNLLFIEQDPCYMGFCLWFDDLKVGILQNCWRSALNACMQDQNQDVSFKRCLMCANCRFFWRFSLGCFKVFEVCGFSVAIPGKNTRGFEKNIAEYRSWHGNLLGHSKKLKNSWSYLHLLFTHLSDF